MGCPGWSRTSRWAPAVAKPRARRERGVGRARSAPTRSVVHAADRCPDCGSALSGGAVKRTREVIELVPSPAEVVEHVVLERRCPQCRRRVVPTVDLGDQVVGQQRLGITLLALGRAMALPVLRFGWSCLLLAPRGLVGSIRFAYLTRKAARQRPPPSTPRANARRHPCHVTVAQRRDPDHHYRAPFGQDEHKPVPRPGAGTEEDMLRTFRNRSVTRAAVALAGASLFLAGCGAGGKTTTTPPAATTSGERGRLDRRHRTPSRSAPTCR